MNIKIWIGDDNSIRNKVMSLIDVEKFGGNDYFNNCTSIFIYQGDKFDVRCGQYSRSTFDEHKNKELKITD